MCLKCTSSVFHSALFPLGISKWLKLDIKPNSPVLQGESTGASIIEPCRAGSQGTSVLSYIIRRLQGGPGSTPLSPAWMKNILLLNPRGSQLVLVVKKPSANVGDIRSLGWEDPLKEGTTTHSSILAWRIPRTEEPGRL